MPSSWYAAQNVRSANLIKRRFITCNIQFSSLFCSSAHLGAILTHEYILHFFAQSMILLDSSASHIWNILIIYILEYFKCSAFIHTTNGHEFKCTLVEDFNQKATKQHLFCYIESQVDSRGLASKMKLCHTGHTSLVYVCFFPLRFNVFWCSMSNADVLCLHTQCETLYD